MGIRTNVSSVYVQGSNSEPWLREVLFEYTHKLHFHKVYSLYYDIFTYSGTCLKIFEEFIRFTHEYRLKSCHSADLGLDMETKRKRMRVFDNTGPRPSRKAARIGENTAMYFDIIPTNTLETIIRWTSEAPRAEAWVDRIIPRKIVPLFRASGELGNYLLTLFDKLHLNDSTRQDIWERKKERGMVQDNSNGFPGWALEVAGALAGKNIRSLYISIRGSTASSMSSSQYTLLNMCPVVWQKTHPFPNIERLSYFSYGDERWLRKFGGNLKALCIQNVWTSDLNSIPKHCPLLRELRLSNVDSVKPSLWIAVGKNLEILEILKSKRYALKDIRAYCRKLTVIQIHHTDGHEIEYMNLLASYGDQLEYAVVPQTLSSHTITLVRECTRAAFYLKIHHPSSNDTLSLKALGYRLEKILVVDPAYASSRLCWDPCTGIELARFLRATHLGICDFFASPKRNLLSLTIRWTSALDNIENAMNRASLSTGALKEFRLILERPISPKAILSVLERNKSLEIVRLLPIYVNQMVDASSETVISSVSFLLDCPEIKVIDLYSRDNDIRISAENETIARLCHRNRFRQICVRVCGRKYLE